MTKKLLISPGSSQTEELVLPGQGGRGPSHRAFQCDSSWPKYHSWNKQSRPASRSQMLPNTSGSQWNAVIYKVGGTQTVLAFVGRGHQFEIINILCLKLLLRKSIVLQILFFRYHFNTFKSSSSGTCFALMHWSIVVPVDRSFCKYYCQEICLDLIIIA